VLRLTEEPAFRRRVTAEVAANTPVTGANMLWLLLLADASAWWCTTAAVCALLQRVAKVTDVPLDRCSSRTLVSK
jgi:hypothetical protein